MNRIRIRSWATGDERPVLAGAIDDLLRSAALAEQLEVSHEPAPDLADLQGSAAGTVCVVSLAAFADAEQAPWDNTEAGLRALCADLAERGCPTFVMTVFRRVADRTSQAGHDMLVRIRRLNLLATELSREYGVFVVDIDRVLAAVGGLALGGDFRLRSAAAAQLASEELALALASHGLEEALPFEAQEKIRSAIEVRRASPRLIASLSPSDVVTMAGGAMRRRQRVSIAIDADQENHVGWLTRQVLSGRIGWREAVNRLTMAIRRRGLRESVRLLASAMSQLLQRRRISA